MVRFLLVARANPHASKLILMHRMRFCRSRWRPGSGSPLRRHCGSPTYYILLLLYTIEREGCERLNVMGATRILERGSLALGVDLVYTQQSVHSCPGERKPDTRHRFGSYATISPFYALQRTSLPAQYIYITINASTILLHIFKWTRRSAHFT